MSQQRRTIIGACDYSIATMQNLKRDLTAIGAINADLNWAIGGIVSTLVSNLLQICNQVFQESIANGEPDARHDIEEIGSRLNQFIERMVSHD